MTDITSSAVIVCVSPDLIQIEVFDANEYSNSGSPLEIGSYLKISDDSGLSIIAIVQSYRIKDFVGDPGGQSDFKIKFIVNAQPVGRLEGDKFHRGGKHIAIPPSTIEVASDDVLRNVYEGVAAERRFVFSSLAQNADIRVAVDGDRFFGKHIGVVGSTGSGKSCTVARILQQGIRGNPRQRESGVLNNSHVVIFDLHGEYPSAFPSANIINTSTLKLPYWLMNSEELEEMFIESNEENSHNQTSQFRQAVVSNKKRHAPDGLEVSYDSPSYFSLSEVFHYLYNLNTEVVGKLPKENRPKLVGGGLVDDRAEKYFDGPLSFVEQSSAKDSKASNGPFNGEFGRFLMRLEARMGDGRLGFLLNPVSEGGEEYKTGDFSDLIQQFVGYGTSRSNVTVIDLSGIPFEVMSVVVSLITRLIFTLSFHLKRVGATAGEPVPFLLVYEEAHNYIPQISGSRYGSVKRSIERIAKEGRKYGVSLMIVSQRPSEISETVFSQCSNFVAMRLTNAADQRYVKKLLPDNVGAVTDALPSLESREAIIIGDSIPVPALVKIDDVIDRPDSHDVAFYTEWQDDWRNIDMANVVSAWKF